MSKPLIERMREWMDKGTPDSPEDILKDISEASGLIDEAIQFFEAIGKAVK